MSYLYEQGNKHNRRPFSISPELCEAFRRDPPSRNAMRPMNDGTSSSPEKPVYTVHGPNGHWAVKTSMPS